MSLTVATEVHAQILTIKRRQTDGIIPAGAILIEIIIPLAITTQIEATSAATMARSAQEAEAQEAL